MLHFSWNCFEVTGDLDAYLLYKDIESYTKLRDDLNNGMEDDDSK
ncbi:YqzL family protein [Hazenella sp. IB182357]|uniref:YqzL family protein n=1 Tax=Polycladospora coralii TaxID=2771432 RepID=A0A926N8D4_9BACL|nr:YqzL family protein [Polycladospora coralii]MBD1371172.1 YqzL family protein [Polycladospora coralii]MBS7530114.1 YqzL family protein [Polycladospora coralii]